MLIIRFSRVGKKNHAYYRMVVAENSSPVKGRFLEEVGSYNPHLKQAQIKKERVEYWLSQGVQTSDSVWNLLIKEGIASGEKRKINIKQASTKEEKEEKGKEASAEKTEAKKNEELKTEENSEAKLKNEPEKNEDKTKEEKVA